MIRAKKNKISPTRLACFIALQCTFSLSHPACAREYFNPALLGIDGPGKDISDLSAFEEGVGQMPGTYRVDVLVNRFGKNRLWLHGRVYILLNHRFMNFPNLWCCFVANYTMR